MQAAVPSVAPSRARGPPPAEATVSGDPATQTKPEPTELEEAARAADGAFVVVKEKPDYSEDEPLPQADPPAAASWVFVRDLERVDPPKRVEPPKQEAPPIRPWALL